MPPAGTQRNQATRTVADTTPAELVELIVGRTRSGSPAAARGGALRARAAGAPGDIRPGAVPVTQSCDVLATADGLLFVTDTNAGLSVMEFDGV